MFPTFNSFSLNDGTFITERVIFRGYSTRGVIRAQLNRREGVKLLATEFGEGSIEVDGRVVAASASDLQSKLDSMKAALTTEEGDLVIETGRTWAATVNTLVIPDEHYNNSTAPFQVTFVCTNPFATGALLTVVQNVVSGLLAFSGLVNISGTLFARPTIAITPTGFASGHTNIRSLTITHTPTGQMVTVSGFGNGTDLDYANPVTVDLDAFTALEGSTAKDLSGTFPRWQPGNNAYTITISGHWTNGTVTLSYKPRYL